MEIQKKGKSFCNCLIALNSRMLQIYNANNQPCITMLNIILHYSLFYYSRLVYSFFAGSLTYRHLFTSAPHAHA